MLKKSSLQQRLWRWHFFAGLMVAPFGILLALSGGIYLFKSQIDAYQEAGINAGATLGGKVMSAPELVGALLERYPQASVRSFTLAKANDASVEVELNLTGEAVIFWLSKYTGEVLGQVQKDQQILQLVKKFHGELLAGDYGSYLVELMACWMIVLIISGLFLWLPGDTDKSTLANLRAILLPKLRQLQARDFWRKLHGSVGAWISLMMLVLLISGLPWTQVWGGGFSQLQQYMGWTNPAQQATEFKRHQHHGPAKASSNNASYENEATSHALFGQLVQQVQQFKLASPVIIQPPKSAIGHWTVRSQSQNRTQRRVIHFHAINLQPILNVGFENHHIVKQITSYGIALHEGALFGWLNQLLGVLAALGVVLVSVSGLTMAWRRRPLTAPRLDKSYRLSKTLLCSIALLAVLLPLFGLSLLLLGLAEKAMQRLGFSETVSSA